VGGICIGCTMPGFPDKFMPFMQEPPGAIMSSAAVLMYGRTVRALRNFTKASLDKEPNWRKPGPELTSGYHAPQSGAAHPLSEPSSQARGSAHEPNNKVNS
jgi:hydrogenase small subunit